MFEEGKGMREAREVERVEWQERKKEREKMEETEIEEGNRDEGHEDGGERKTRQISNWHAIADACSGSQVWTWSVSGSQLFAFNAAVNSCYSLARLPKSARLS